MRDYVGIANQYIDNILTGNIPACKWVKQACKRQQKDLKNKKLHYQFDNERASHVCQFIELLPHVKGKWAREKKLLTLEPWQIFILTTCFGWIDKSGYRRFKTIYAEIPRKNGKSALSSGVALYCLVADEEEGAEVYSAATTRDQAQIVWRTAKRMVDKSIGLQRRFGVSTSAHSVFVEHTDSFFKSLSKDTGGNHDGYSVSCAIIDELHAHKTREIFDVVETGTGSRDQPVLFLITTAGFNRAGIRYEQRNYVCRVLDRKDIDEEYFGIIFTIDKDDNWTDSNNWIKANPNWDVSVKPSDIQRKARKAMVLASAQNNFKTKHLNLWVNADSAWLDMRDWEACEDNSLSLDDFEGENCEMALDLASKIDIAAKVLLFRRNDEYYVFGTYYLPEETIDESDNSQYAGWVEDKWLTETDGERIDYRVIKDDMMEDSNRFEVNNCSYDPFQATQLSTEMIDEGFSMIEVGATVKNFSDPMKELEALVISGKIHHDGSPVLTWMMGNVVCHTDKKDNIYPNKESNKNKIDGVIALIMALNRMMLNVNDEITEEDLLFL